MLNTPDVSTWDVHDPDSEWDGHTTKEKYERILSYIKEHTERQG